MKKKFVFLALIAVVLCLFSCDTFFSTSWGKPRKFTSANITVSPDNVDQWVERALSDPALAGEITKAIKDKLNDPDLTDPEEKAKLAGGGAKLAVAASGIGELIFTNAEGVIGGLFEGEGFSQETLTELLKDLLDGISKEAADDLTEIVGHCYDNRGQSVNAPYFENDFIEQLTPGDAVQVVMVLALAELGEELGDTGFTDINDLTNLTAGLGFSTANIDGVAQIVVPDDASEKTVALVAYLNVMNSDPKFTEGLGGEFLGLFF
jgi:hypothetical protein